MPASPMVIGSFVEFVKSWHWCSSPLLALYADKASMNTSPFICRIIQMLSSLLSLIRNAAPWHHSRYQIASHGGGATFKR